MQAQVTSVIEPEIGSTLISQAGTTLTVEDPDEFDADGGQLTIGGEVRAYTLAANGTLTIASALTGTYAEDEPVLVYPVQTERVALLLEPGGEEELEARVPHSLHERLALGARDEDGEVVEVEWVGEELVVVDVIAQEPPIDVGYLSGMEMNAGKAVITGIPANPVCLSDAIPHGLSAEPTAVVATAVAMGGTKGTGRVNVTVQEVGATTFKVRIKDTREDNLNAPAGTDIHVYWIAVLTPTISGQPGSSGGAGHTGGGTVPVE